MTVELTGAWTDALTRGFFADFSAWLLAFELAALMAAPVTAWVAAVIFGLDVMVFVENAFSLVLLQPIGWH